MKFDTSESSPSSTVWTRVLKEVLVAWLVCTPPALAIMLLAAPALMDTDTSQVPNLSLWLHRFGAVLVAPLVETLMMVPVFAVLERVLPRHLLTAYRMPVLALGSAALWSIAHGYFAVAWGVGTFWPFVVFSFMFLRWKRHGLTVAIAAVAAVHALQNGSVVALNMLLVG